MRILLLVVALIGFAPLLAAEPPHVRWNSGDLWYVSVTRRPGAPDAQTYTLRVLFNGVENLRGFPSMRVMFLADKDAPRDVPQQTVVWIDRETGWTRKAEVAGNGNKTELMVDRFADVTWVTRAPDGIPLEYLPELPDRDVVVPDHPVSFKIASTVEGKARKREGTTSAGGKRELSVRQTWPDGEKWWTEYERDVDGKTVLTAKRIDAPPKTPSVKPPAPPPNPYYLRLDGRLNRQLTFVKHNPTTAELLAAIEQATGLSLTLSPELARHAPRFGLVNLKNARASALMEHMERLQLTDGRWERSGDGYRLTGTSSALVPEEPPPARPPYLAYCVALLSVVAVGFWVRSRWLRPSGKPTVDGRP